jgi:hypothetical protein
MTMKNEALPEPTMPEPSDHVQVAREDTYELDRDDSIGRRADALALDPYSPIEPDVTDPAAIRSF